MRSGSSSVATSALSRGRGRWPARAHDRRAPAAGARAHRSRSSARTAQAAALRSAVSTPRLLLQELRPRAHGAFDDDAHPARRLGHLADDRDRADAVQIVRRRLVGLVLLHQQQDHPIARERAVDRLDRHRPADTERRHGHRQHNGFAQRNDGKIRRKGGSCGGSAMMSVLHRLGEPRFEQHHPAIDSTGGSPIPASSAVKKSFRVASAFQAEGCGCRAARTRRFTPPSG